MAKARASVIEEDEEGCESSRGKEGKFVAERSDPGMNTSGSAAAKSPAPAGGGGSSSGGSGGDEGTGSAAGNGISSAGDGDGDDCSAGNSKDNNEDREHRRGDSGRDRSSRSSRYRVPSNYCRDFIFYTCKRKGCKFEHPEPDSAEYKEARASRPYIGSRGDNHHERNRSRSPPRSESAACDDESNSGGGGGGGSSNTKQTVCRDFLRNMCYRGIDCRYMHPTDGEGEELPWPQLCIDYRAGTCKRFDCRFLHYGNEDEEYYLRTGSVNKELWQHFVSITLKDPNILKSRPVCKLFLQSGECSMSVCRYRHVSQKEYEDDMYQIIQQMVFEKCRRTHGDIPPPARGLPPRDGDMPPLPIPGGPPPPIRGDMDGGFPPAPTFRDYQHSADGGPGGRGGDDWGGPPRGGGSYGGGFPRPPDGNVSLEMDQVSRENSELRRMMAEDNARYKVDVDRLNMENSKLQEQISYLKSSASGTLHQQYALLQQENNDYSAKIKSINDWSVELQAKFSTARRECDELRDSVKVLNLELATVNEEKIKLKRKSDELEAKLQVALATKDEANLAIEKKEYLESKLKQYYEGMKRCESEFIGNLEKNFHITTPNVMSYFPSWAYLMSFVTEIVTQINNTSSQSKAFPSAIASSVGFGGYGPASGNGGYGSGTAASGGNYSVPPPSVGGAGGYGGYSQDYSGTGASQYSGGGGTSGGQQAVSGGGYSGSSANNGGYYGQPFGGYGGYGGGGDGSSGGGGGANSAGPYGTTSVSGSQYVGTSSYGNAAAAAPVPAMAGDDKGRSSSSSKSGGGGGGGGSSSSSSSSHKKDGLLNPPPWKKRN